MTLTVLSIARAANTLTRCACRGHRQPSSQASLQSGVTLHTGATSAARSSEPPTREIQHVRVVRQPRIITTSIVSRGTAQPLTGVEAQSGQDKYRSTPSPEPQGVWQSASDPAARPNIEVVKLGERPSPQPQAEAQQVPLQQRMRSRVMEHD